MTVWLRQAANSIWSSALVLVCLAAGLFLTFRLRGVQFRMIRDTVHLLGERSDRKGISAFQSFAATVGARVGMGNMAGVAGAIFFGGPGAVFWMWVIAVIGAASAFTESVLAQAYKIKTKDGVFAGGPAYYLERGLRCRPYAVAFAVLACLGPGLLMPAVQTNALADIFHEAFQLPPLAVGVVFCALLAFAVCGSIGRISKLAELLAPLMCAVYLLLAGGVLLCNLGRLPEVLATIVRSALGLHPLLGGMVGSAVTWGVKRGIYSNEAGMGCGAVIAGAAQCSHPVKQGLVQVFSVYVDTLVVGTATALILLLSDSADGAGIGAVRLALVRTYGSPVGRLLALLILLFVFTSMTSCCYQAEANLRYLSRDNATAVWVGRTVFLAASFWGVIGSADAVWAMGEIGCGLMAWGNILAIVLLSPMAVKLLQDYEAQKKAKKNPVFHPEKFGIRDDTGAWT